MRKDSFWLAILIVLGTLIGILWFINPNLVYRARDVVIRFVSDFGTIIWNKIQNFGVK